MFRFFLKKILIFLLSLWAIATITFFLMHALPGDPFIGDQVVPEEVLTSLYRYYGLDQPLFKQYGSYLKNLLEGNLGSSILYADRTVNQLISQSFPISAQIGLQALLIAFPLGIFLGTFSALKKGSWQDSSSILIATLGVSLPNFVVATLLQYFFSIYLSWFPIARWGGFEHTVLPSLSLAFLPTAFIARLTRSSMVEVLQQGYIKTAIGKGLPLWKIALRHALPNALLPLVSYLAPVTAQILMGSFMVERIFALPGLGQWMIHSIHGRDYPTIIGLTLFFSFLLLTSTLLVDLIMGWIDPRVRYKEAR